MEILVVDDNPQNVKLLSTVLQNEGYSINSASDGIEALTLIRDSTPDLIISDVLMPGMDGYSLCYECRNDPALKDIVFIFYSAAYTEPMDKELAFVLGVDRFLTKPMGNQELVKEIREVILSKKKRTPFEFTPEKSREYYKKYSERVVHQLEQKVTQLEESNEQLRKNEQILEGMNRELDRKVFLRTRELEIINKELESFSYSVSHDLKGPLRRIDGFSQFVLESNESVLDDESTSYLQRIKSNIKDMNLLIEDLLKLSKISQQKLVTEKINLSDLAEDVWNEISQGHPERIAKFSVEKDIYVNADLKLLRIALDNLMGNAWKYSSKKPETNVSLEARKDNEKIIYQIKDNGAGFDPAYADKLFTAFQRLHSPDEFEGTGIGLATVARIIHRHGGEIWAEAETGKGATFYFTLG